MINPLIIAAPAMYLHLIVKDAEKFEPVLLADEDRDEAQQLVNGPSDYSVSVITSVSIKTFNKECRL